MWRRGRRSARKASAVSTTGGAVPRRPASGIRRCGDVAVISRLIGPSDVVADSAVHTHTAKNHSGLIEQIGVGALSRRRKAFTQGSAFTGMNARRLRVDHLPLVLEAACLGLWLPDRPELLDRLRIAIHGNQWLRVCYRTMRRQSVPW